MAEPRSLLVIQPAFLGDVVFTSALVDSIGARFPAARIDVCVTPRGRDIVLAMPRAAAPIVFDKRGADRGPGGLLRAVARVKGHELALLPHRSLRSGLLARLARISRRIGFRGAPASMLYTERVPSVGDTFLGKEAQLALALGATPLPMRLRTRPEWMEAVDPTIRHLGAFAALCIGSEWATKIWPAVRFAGLADALWRQGLAPVLIGGPNDRESAAAVNSAARVKCIDTTGNSVGEALALLSQAALCVGGDTGLVHAARALGTPTVALFGPTAPERHVFGPRSLSVSTGLECSPCSEHGQERCPLGHHKCLRDLDVERVVDACEAAIA
ncbi:MAG: glycosyltransferase family 9 protein [Deltaproteobacteria bacterium]|nr:MAG: glycosyltransferase family 9 protein [Deltaproteobacteria bacterium]TMB30745.1 MAG: glycosyltransferase family 9 protein [Deltaproteobacteria bacterium]TMB38525.1 MAG: glycosyltransferase family 9 protein [Deltaproteobacteria bacterium]